MASIIDSDFILSKSEQWNKLEEEWGDPIDLEVYDDEEILYPKLRPGFSTLILKGTTTLDSSFHFKKIRHKTRRHISQKSTTSLDYTDFINDLKREPDRESLNQFYFINGQVVSAVSVEKICDEIDNVFKSIEKLSSASSTMRKKERNFPEIVQCSISTSGLSFDDTVVKSVEQESFDVVLEMNIEEALNHFNDTIAGIEDVDKSTFDSVTTLVRKYSRALNETTKVGCSPKRKQRQDQCCKKFRELVTFWRSRE